MLSPLPPFIPLPSLPLFPFLFFPTVQICSDLGNTVSGGTVQYSQSLLQGGYPEGTTATVTCNEGFSGGGDITCQSESWSGSLPGCTGKFSSLKVHTQIRYSLHCLLVMYSQLPKPHLQLWIVELLHPWKMVLSCHEVALHLGP